MAAIASTGTSTGTMLDNQNGDLIMTISSLAVASTSDIVTFENELSALTDLQSSIVAQYHDLQTSIIEFSIRFDSLVAAGKRLDKETGTTKCHDQLAAVFGNDYLNKTRRSKFRSIASKADVFQNPMVLENLPASGRDTLYALSRLDGDTIIELVEKGSIHPTLTYREASILVNDQLGTTRQKQPSHFTLAPATPNDAAVEVKFYFASMKEAAAAIENAKLNYGLIAWDSQSSTDFTALKSMITPMALAA
jgi:hypothetical protein